MLRSRSSQNFEFVTLRSCFADCMTFKTSFSFSYGSGIAQELPLRRQVWICDDLSWWLIQKNLPEIAPTPLPCMPEGLRGLKVA